MTRKAVGRASTSGSGSEARPARPAGNAKAGLSGGRLLDPFLKPRSVAIIGLSRTAVGAPVSVLTSLAELGYEGRIHVVNPGMMGTPGLNVCARVADLPEAVDLAVISVERSRVPDVLEECAQRGIKSAIIITQGFGDADAEGQRLQARITEISRRAGLRIIGPNTVGVAAGSFTSSFIEVRPQTVPVGQVAQSGLFMMGHHLVNNEPAGFCQAVDLGNACDIGLIDVLEHYEHEDDVRVIECHAEAIGDGAAFVETAGRIARNKPVIVLKSGNTELGRAAVASHTGAVAGTSEVYRAAFRKAGVVEAESAEELRLLSKSFVTYNPPRGRRVAVMSFSGGGAVLAIDALDSAGLKLAELSPATLAEIRELFPPWMEVSNPLDVWIPMSKDLHSAFPKILERLLTDDAVDAVLCIYCSYNLPKYDLYDASGHIRELASRHPDKPVLCWTYGLDIEGITRKIEAGGSAVVFPTLDSAAKTLAKLAAYGERRAGGLQEAQPRLDADHRKIRTILDGALGQGREYIFSGGLEILQACGLDLAPWRLAANEDQLAATARELSFPLCLKIVSPDLIHKSDSGGVRLGLASEAELLDAYRAMLGTIRARFPNARIEGALVQEMVGRGQEVMIGMKRDPSFGPCVVFGAGGIYAELLHDFAFRIAPLTREDARAMIEETRIAGILKGARGKAPCDLGSITDLLLRVSQLACENPEILEIDLNPVFVTESAARVVDTRFILTAGTGHELKKG